MWSPFVTNIIFVIYINSLLPKRLSWRYSAQLGEASEAPSPLTQETRGIFGRMTAGEKALSSMRKTCQYHLCICNSYWFIGHYRGPTCIVVHTKALAYFGHCTSSCSRGSLLLNGLVVGLVFIMEQLFCSPNLLGSSYVLTSTCLLICHKFVCMKTCIWQVIECSTMH
jgi:hypothetical protein